MLMLWILAVLFIILAVYLFLIAPDLRCPDDSALRGWLYAHRGLHDGNQQVIENSLEAFRLAVENGYGMELDVQLTRDNQLVVHHDGSLKRICGVDRKICETDYADLPLLPDRSRIPLLTEVLSLVNGRVPLIVEVKRDGGAWKNAEGAWAVLRDYKGPYCVESFDPIAMRYFRLHAPHIVRGQLSEGDKWDPESICLSSHLLLKHLLMNVISRPHFVAYSVPTDHVPAMWLMKRVFHPRLAAWTIRSQELLDASVQAGYHFPIFEKFVPREKKLR